MAYKSKKTQENSATTNLCVLLLFFFSPCRYETAAAHPRHYAENGLRLLEEGDGVEGSSGFPGSVRLHPLHGPPPPPRTAT